MAVIGEAELDIRGRTSGFARDVEQGVLASTRKVAAAGAGLGAALGVGKIVKDIGTIGVAYQDTLNVFQSVSGATVEELGRVRAETKALGNDLTLPATSAADAATALTELSKAGLSVNETLAAGKGTLQLSIAGTISAGEAATVTANALNAFGLAGSEAATVANVLANAANVSSGEVTDFAMGLSQSALVANQAGLSIQETTGALALFANEGLRGSDAGTSLKTALLRLQAPIGSGAEAIKALGANFRDANGDLLPLAGIAREVQEELSGLSSAQRDAALSAIFGQDAIRVGAILYEEGAAGIEKFTESVSKAGGAQEVAAAKSQGLGGALRGLQSQAETLQIDIFEKVAPSIEAGVRAVSESAPQFVAVASGVVTSVASAIAPLATSISEPIVSGLGAGLSAVKDFLVGLTDAGPEAGRQTGVLLEGLDPGRVDVASKYESLGESIRAGIQRGISDIDPADLGQKIGETLAAAVNTIGSAARPLVEGMGRFFRDVAPDIALEFGKQAPTILLGFAVGLLNFDIVSLFGFVADNFVGVLLGALTIAFAPAKLIGFAGKIPFVGPLIEGLLRGGQRLLRPVFNFAGRILDDLGRGFVTGIRRVFPALGSRLGSELSLIPTRLGLARIRAQEIARAIPGQIGDAIQGLAGILGRIAGQAVGIFLRPFTGLAGIIRGAGSRVVDGLVVGLLSRFPRVFASILNLTTGIRRAFSNPGAFLSDIGRQIVDGLVSGIRGSAGRVADAARALADRIPGPIRRLLGISSPSRVTTEIGRQVAAGLVLGLDKGAGEVAAAVQRLVGAAVPSSLGLTAGDLAAAVGRATATDVDRALGTRDAAVTARGPAAAAASAAAASAAAASASYANLEQKATGANNAVARLNDQIARERNRQREANATRQEAARRLADQARAARRAADAAADGSRAERDLKARAVALERQAQAAQRGVQAAAAASTALVAQLTRQRDAQKKVADAATDAARAAKESADDRVRTAKETADELLRIEEQLADAQAALADAVRKEQVAVAQGAVSAISAQVDALVAKADGLRSAFSTSVLEGSSFADLFSSGLTTGAQRVEAGLRDLEGANVDVTKAQNALTKATLRYQEVLGRQQEKIAVADAEAARRQAELQDATAARVRAEQAVAAARAVATDGAAASALELADLRGAYDLLQQAQKAEEKAQEKAGDAAADAAEARAKEVDGLDDVQAAQQALAEAQQAAVEAARAYGEAQAAAANTVARAISDLQIRLTDAKRFATDLGTLAGLGLNDTLLAQVAALGPKVGSQLATSLIAAGPTALAQVNSLTEDIGRVASTGLDVVAENLYGPGARVLQSLLDGIRSRFPELDATIAQINAKLATIAGQRAEQERAEAAAAEAAAAAARPSRPRTAPRRAGESPGDIVRRRRLDRPSQQAASVSIGDTNLNFNAIGMTPEEVQARVDQVLRNRNAEVVRLVRAGVSG